MLSSAGKRTLVAETSWSVKQVEALADVVYEDRDIGASLASGSFHTAGMIIAPCSIKTVAALAKAFRRVFRSDKPMVEAVEELINIQDEEVHKLKEFLENWMHGKHGRFLEAFRDQQ